MNSHYLPLFLMIGRCQSRPDMRVGYRDGRQCRQARGFPDLTRPKSQSKFTLFAPQHLLIFVAVNLFLFLSLYYTLPDLSTLELQVNPSNLLEAGRCNPHSHKTIPSIYTWVTPDQVEWSPVTLSSYTTSMYHSDGTGVRCNCNPPRVRLARGTRSLFNLR